jgi:hypothetical protein
MRMTRTAVFAAALAALVLPGAARAQQPTSLSRTAEASAVIEAVDQRERSVILRNDQGELITLHLGKEVRNLPQVKAGDRVVMRVTQAVAVEMAKPSDTRPPVAAGEAAGVAPPGSMLGGAYVRGVRALVTVKEIDRRNNTVTITGPEGNTRTVEVRNPKMREFVRHLKAGDQVQLAIAEGVTIDVVR